MSINALSVGSFGFFSGVDILNPAMMAGTFGYFDEYADIPDIPAGLSAVPVYAPSGFATRARAGSVFATRARAGSGFATRINLRSGMKR